MPGPFPLEQNVITAMNQRITIGNYHSDDAGENVQYIRRDGFWLDSFRVGQIFKPNPFSEEFRDRYEESKENENTMATNAMRNTMLYWQLDAGHYDIWETRDTDNIYSNGINLNLSAGAKIPLRPSAKNMKYKSRHLSPQTMYPNIGKGRLFFVKTTNFNNTTSSVTANESDNSIKCNEQHHKTRNIEYSLLANTNIGYTFSGIEPNSIANARFIEERGVLKQSYYTIDTNVAETNPLPDDVKYVKGRTRKHYHEEIISDMRQEYGTLVEKLKSAGVDNPDQFIKDYTENFYVVGEYAYLNDLKERSKDSYISDFDTQNLFAQNTDDDDKAYIDAESNQYFHEHLGGPEPDMEPLLKGRSTFSNDDNKETRRTKDVTGQYNIQDSRQEWANQINQYSDIVNGIHEKIQQIKDKYNVDILDLNLTEKEYTVLTQSQDIYEYTPEEIEEIKSAQAKLSNQIYNGYIKVAKETQDNSQLREWQLRENVEKLGNSTYNAFVDFYNNQLNGTPYADIKAGINTDIALNNGCSLTGQVYGQVGLGYINDYWDLSAGIEVEAGNYRIGNDNVSKPTLNPYVELKLDPLNILSSSDERNTDFERFQKDEHWLTTFRYEPRTQTFMAGVSLNATPRQMKKR